MRSIAGTIILLAALSCPAFAEQTHQAAYNRDGEMMTYTDLESGITLRISKDRHRVTATDSRGQQLWSRADYLEPMIRLPGEPVRKPLPAEIGVFEPMPAGKIGQVERTFAHRLGLRDPVLMVRYSAKSCCGGAQGYMSEIDGKLVNTGTN